MIDSLILVIGLLFPIDSVDTKIVDFNGHKLLYYEYCIEGTLVGSGFYNLNTKTKEDEQ